MALLQTLRRGLIQRRPFPELWLEILHERVPHYRILPHPLQAELRRHLPVFLSEKRFEGCGGLKITEEMKVVIGALAMLISLGEPTGYYPGLTAILVYPDDYIAPLLEEDEAGIMTEGEESRSGESWGAGSIVLSWREIEEDLREPFRGRNLVFHEFAHQIDGEVGATAGLDETGGTRSAEEWSRALSLEYLRLGDAVARGKQTLLDPYGATHPAEFFAVVTEMFFDSPLPLKKGRPALYKQFRDFYRLDPAAWSCPS